VFIAFDRKKNFASSEIVKKFAIFNLEILNITFLSLKVLYELKGPAWENKRSIIGIEVDVLIHKLKILWS
jgi:hypothetical protein